MRVGEPLGIGKVKEAGKEIRESDFGGTSHACEFETSLYLALKPELVQMEKAVDERSPMSSSFRFDLLSGGIAGSASANLMPYWSALTASGVMGDATLATREKGEKFLEAAIQGLVDLTLELKSNPIPTRRDQHSPNRG